MTKTTTVTPLLSASFRQLQRLFSLDSKNLPPGASALYLQMLTSPEARQALQRTKSKLWLVKFVRDIIDQPVRIAVPVWFTTTFVIGQFSTHVHRLQHEWCMRHLTDVLETDDKQIHFIARYERDRVILATNFNPSQSLILLYRLPERRTRTFSYMTPSDIRTHLPAMQLEDMFFMDNIVDDRDDRVDRDDRDDE